MLDSQKAQAGQEGSLRYPGWRVVFVCFWMAVFAWGFGFYGHSVYLAELQRLHGWPAAAIGSASTVYYLTSAVLIAFVSDAIAAMGTRRFVLAGVGMLAVSALALPHVSSLPHVYVVYLVMAFGWAALSLGGITNILGPWFQARRGFAISVALNGASMGGVALAPALVWLSGEFGFASAMRLMTGCMLVTLIPMVWVWMRAPGAMMPASVSIAAPGAALHSASPSGKLAALKDPRFWSVTGPFALALASQVGFIVHFVAYLTPLLGRTGTGWALAITTTMAVIGRVGLGTVIDRLDQRLVSAVSFTSQAAALFVMTQTTNELVLIGACAAYGLSVGNLITFPALIIQREFEPQAFGMIIALSTAVNQFTYAFGPALLGLIRDLTNSYAAALALCIGLNILAAIGILAGRQRRVA
jgi:MFS family permease